MAAAAAVAMAAAGTVAAAAMAEAAAITAIAANEKSSGGNNDGSGPSAAIDVNGVRVGGAATIEAATANLEGGASLGTKEAPLAFERGDGGSASASGQVQDRMNL
jgi:hypothetical protein